MKRKRDIDGSHAHYPNCEEMVLSPAEESQDHEGEENRGMSDDQEGEFRMASKYTHTTES